MWKDQFMLKDIIFYLIKRRKAEIIEISDRSTQKKY